MGFTSYYVLLVLFLLTFYSVETQISEGVPCETLSGGFGDCISIKRCEPLLDLLIKRSNDPAVRKLLVASTCGNVNNVPLVCCPKSGTARNNPTDSNQNNNVSPVNVNILKPPACGKSNETITRVVNGYKAKLGQFPWMVLLGYRNSKNPDLPRWLCGGSLITTRHVLTAAHCVQNRPDLYLARLGELTLYDDQDEAEPEDIPLVKAKVHPNFSLTEFTNDIAILTLEREPRNGRVWPICLPFFEPLRSKNFVNTQSYVAGWGSVKFREARSLSLLAAQLPVLNTQYCETAYQNKSKIDDRIICAGYLNGKKDACEGDSGGPLMHVVIDNIPYYYVIGVVSYGYRCGEPGYPGVYTRVTSFMDWISNNLS